MRANGGQRPTAEQPPGPFEVPRLMIETVTPIPCLPQRSLSSKCFAVSLLKQWKPMEIDFDDAQKPFQRSILSESSESRNFLEAGLNFCRI